MDKGTTTIRKKKHGGELTKPSVKADERIRERVTQWQRINC